MKKSYLNNNTKTVSLNLLEDEKIVNMFNHCQISKYNVTLPLHINPNVNLVITTTGAKLKSGNTICAGIITYRQEVGICQGSY